jgi:hypothetical protein
MTLTAIQLAVPIISAPILFSEISGSEFGEWIEVSYPQVAAF